MSTPQSSVEQYLSVIAGHGGEIPSEPASRVEYFLNEIVKQGGIGGKLKPKIVAALPQTGETGLLYLVPVQGSSGQNTHDEYIWIEDTSKFELLGQTKIDVDLSGLVPDTRKISNVPLSADIPVALTGDTAITVTNTGTASAIGYSIAHKDSGVTAGSKGDTTNQTPGFGDTFKVLSATADAKGHVTNISEHSVQIPDTEATRSAKGLMSPADKTKLDTLIDGTLSNDGKAADAKATGNAIANLKIENALMRELINGIDAPIYRNASGNPATFSDADAANVKALSVTITPTQSGSGDPYPPGGGKNQFRGAEFVNTTDKGITFSVTKNSNGDLLEIEANGTSESSNAQIYVIYYSGLSKFSGMILSGAPSGTVLEIQKGSSPYTSYAKDFGNGGVIREIPAGEDCIMFWRIPSSGFSANHLKCYPMIRPASETNPSFAPYSNIRPISGVSSVSVTRAGKNLCEEIVLNSYVYYLNGTFGTDNDGRYSRTKYIPVRAGEVYTVQYSTNGGENWFYDTENNPLRSMPTTSGSVRQFTATQDGYVAFSMFTENVDKFMMERGDSASAYEPYQAQSITVQLTDGSNPLTVYGGTLNVTTGELTVTHRSVTVDGVSSKVGADSAAVGSSTEAIPAVPLIGGVIGANDYSKVIGDRFKTGMSGSAYEVFLSRYQTVGFIAPRIPGIVGYGAGKTYETFQELADAANAWFAKNPSQFVYELETPVTYQLTPQQLATLSGYNAVSTDAGTLSVTYRADTVLSLGGGV